MVDNERSVILNELADDIAEDVRGKYEDEEQG